MDDSDNSMDMMTDQFKAEDFLEDFDFSSNADMVDASNYENAPTAIIVANIHANVFEEPATRAEFENHFRRLDGDVSFIYLKSFRRARLQFSSPDLAGIARIQYDGTSVCGQNIKCYFYQIQQINKDNTLLQPPKPQRVFLISPPASPPVGWEPIPESKPVIDYDLLNALAKLNPGESHEIHPRSLSAPAIVVHLCEDPEGYQPGMKPAIVQTRRP